MSDEMKALSGRVETLERQNRRMKLAFLAACLAVCGFGLLGAVAPVQDELKVKSLMVMSPDGQLAVKIHAPDGTGAIDLWDTNLKNGSPQISIGCIPVTRGGGTQIFMLNAKGHNGVNIVAQERGNVKTW